MSALAPARVLLDPEMLEEYRRERLRKLERENVVLRGERDRLLMLLALALKMATARSSVQPSALLVALCDYVGTNPGKLAVDEYAERVHSEARLARVVDVLRETA